MIDRHHPTACTPSASAPASTARSRRSSQPPQDSPAATKPWRSPSTSNSTLRTPERNCATDPSRATIDTPMSDHPASHHSRHATRPTRPTAARSDRPAPSAAPQPNARRADRPPSPAAQTPLGKIRVRNSEDLHPARRTQRQVTRQARIRPHTRHAADRRHKLNRPHPQKRPLRTDTHRHVSRRHPPGRRTDTRHRRLQQRSSTGSCAEAVAEHAPSAPANTTNAAASLPDRTTTHRQPTRAMTPSLKSPAVHP